MATIYAATFLLIGCGSNKNVEQPTPVQQAEPTPPAAPAKVTNLGMTFEQFKAAYNAMIAENFPSTGWDISSATLKNVEDKDIFIYKFNDNVGLMGEIDKNSGMVKEALVAFIPKTKSETENALVAYVTLMLTLSPELTVEQRGDLIRELKLIGEDVTDLLNQNDGVAVRGNIRYRTTFFKERGVLQFIASAKDIE